MSGHVVNSVLWDIMNLASSLWKKNKVPDTHTRPMESKTLGLCLLLALLHVVQAQDQTSIVPLRPGRTEYVLPCALRVFSYAATGSYMSVTFTAKSAVAFDVYLSPWVPGQEQSKGSLLLDVCLERKRSCSTKSSGETCTITEACGVLTGTWYISVKTTDFVDGFFSISVDTRSMYFSCRPFLNMH